MCGSCVTCKTCVKDDLSKQTEGISVLTRHMFHFYYSVEVLR
jgi:hypothetical protein